jgi:hypothetical protein
MALVCPGCKRALTPGDFYVNRSRPKGVSYLCRRCSRALARRQYALNMAAGLCGCGQPRMPGYLSCRTCRDSARKRKGSRPWQAGGRGRPPGYSPRAMEA